MSYDDVDDGALQALATAASGDLGEEVARKAKGILEQMRILTETLIANQRWSMEPEVGAVLKWERTFKSGREPGGFYTTGSDVDRTYSYLAFRVNTTSLHSWYLTGRGGSSGPVTWGAVKKAIGSRDAKISNVNDWTGV